MVGKKRTGNDRETSKTQIHTHTHTSGKTFLRRQREQRDHQKKRKRERQDFLWGENGLHTKKKRERLWKYTARQEKEKTHTHTRTILLRLPLFWTVSFRYFNQQLPSCLLDLFSTFSSTSCCNYDCPWFPFFSSCRQSVWLLLLPMHTQRGTRETGRERRSRKITPTADFVSGSQSGKKKVHSQK